MTSQETVRNAVFVGEKPVRAYEDYAVMLLRKQGQATLLSRGQQIPRSIYISHRIVRDLRGARIVDEHSYIERLPFKGPDDLEERMRDVPVFSVTLILEDDAAEEPDSFVGATDAEAN